MNGQDTSIEAGLSHGRPRFSLTEGGDDDGNDD